MEKAFDDAPERVPCDPGISLHLSPQSPPDPVDEWWITMGSVLGGVTGLMALALVVGFFVGWFVMGWGLWPVDFVNGTVSQLRPDLQQDWVRLTASEYALNPNIDPHALSIGQKIRIA